MKQAENLKLETKARETSIRVQLSKANEIPTQKVEAPKRDPIFHFSVSVCSRGARRCVIHCVAYRSACKMLSEDGTVIADYTRRRGVIHCEIIAPEIRPAWAMLRNKLWIEAARAETRKNSVEAREFQAAIPTGLSVEDAVTLARAFAQKMVSQHSFVVDFSLHRDNRKTWDGKHKNFDGFHVHFLATTRRIIESGFTEKTRELDIKSSGMVKHWRNQWAALANAALARTGSPHRIDDRSHKERMITRKPTAPLGPKITALERRGIKTAKGDLVREIQS